VESGAWGRVEIWGREVIFFFGIYKKVVWSWI
jgi:hypothetical protein